MVRCTDYSFKNFPKTDIFQNSYFSNFWVNTSFSKFKDFRDVSSA